MLELVATLSVALVAVTVGLRLASGRVDFQVALTVLLLAPEAYWPLRRVGAEFHAAAEGTAAPRRRRRPPGAGRRRSSPARRCRTATGLALRGLEIGYVAPALP